MNTFRRSCDTFVALGDITFDNLIIFGKNSDRPSEEVQEVIVIPSKVHPPASKVHCTYIEIDQVESTYAVILSKPAWMWGAEMGANEHGVVIGNEAVWTKLNSDDDSIERLLGMDLLRLGLERSKTAREAVEVIAKLLEVHGQGGPCSEDDPEMTYHNSFLIADRSEAWVLETADRLWVAQRIDSGARNISNHLTIGEKFDLASENLENIVTSKNLRNSGTDFNFAFSLSQSGTAGESDSRFCAGKKLLDDLAKSKEFTAMDMISILRDEPSGICMKLGGCFVSASSQISILTPPGSSVPCVHFFTGTPDPSISAFKPFVFSGDLPLGSPHLESPVFSVAEDPVKKIPRFQSKVDRQHQLYKLHEAAFSGHHPEGTKPEAVAAALRVVEESCVRDILDAIHDTLAGKRLVAIEEPDGLFAESVMSEITIYKH